MPSSNNKAFVLITRFEVTETQTWIKVDYVTVNPSDTLIAGGLRGVSTATLERSDGQNDVRAKIEAAVRADLNDPSVDVVIV
jgi:hypothetical protein